MAHPVDAWRVRSEMSEPDEPSLCSDDDPLHAPERLEALARTGLLAPDRSDGLDRLTRLAARAVGVPVALISLVTSDRQSFKSEYGLSEPWRTLRGTPLSHSFCRHVVTSGQRLAIADARSHPLVATNAAIDDLGVESYLGLPIRSDSGHVLGSLCVIDHVPRVWTADDERVLSDVRALVEEQLSTLRDDGHWRRILDAVPQMIWSATAEGLPGYFNERTRAFVGSLKNRRDRRAWLSLVHPLDLRLVLASWRACVATEAPFECELRLKHTSGHYRWVLARAVPLRDDGGRTECWFGSCTDIHDLKLIEEQRELISRELNHRIKNIFAVTMSLATLTARDHPDGAAYAGVLRRRLAALATAHEHVRPTASPGSSGAIDVASDLNQLLVELMEPYRQHDMARVSITAGTIAAGPKAATALALILHELATNAVKYGALSGRDGTVTIDCSRDDDCLRLVWRERGGPSLSGHPEQTGFGSELIMRAATSQLGAVIEQDWAPDGLTVSLNIPVEELSR